jgi:hypothetical protein
MREVVSFGPFRLNLVERALEREGVAVPLGGRAMDVLIKLIERPGELVDRHELMASVWPKLIVEEGNLRLQVTLLRKALEDGHHGARYITNIPRRGYSRSEAAVPLLVNLAKVGGGLGQQADTWIEALGRLGVPAARQALLGLVDPATPVAGALAQIDYHAKKLLGQYVSTWAREDLALRNRLLRLSEAVLTPVQKELLLEIYGALGTDDALMAGLTLVNSIPFSLGEGLDQLFFERRRYGSSGTFTLSPRNAQHIRARLFDTVLKDQGRRHTALSMLGQIEVWRLEHERPIGEPRHPMIEAQVPWPPLAYMTPTGHPSPGDP